MANYTKKLDIFWSISDPNRQILWLEIERQKHWFQKQKKNEYMEKLLNK